GGTVTGGAASVLVEGRPAARALDPHSEPTPLLGHGPVVIAGGSGTVLAEGRPLARQGDTLTCGAPLTPTQGSVHVG
uniref:PAAR domain-containing protein n=1 Tax=Deinococcus pimensis TaxID=309888 RepID=UPI0004885A5C